MSTCKQFPQIPIVEYSIVCSVIARDQKRLVTRDQNLLKKKKKKAKVTTTSFMKANKPGNPRKNDQGLQNPTGESFDRDSQSHTSLKVGATYRHLFQISCWTNTGFPHISPVHSYISIPSFPCAPLRTTNYSLHHCASPTTDLRLRVCRIVYSQEFEVPA